MFEKTNYVYIYIYIIYFNMYRYIKLGNLMGFLSRIKNIQVDDSKRLLGFKMFLAGRCSMTWQTNSGVGFGRYVGTYVTTIWKVVVDSQLLNSRAAGSGQGLVQHAWFNMPNECLSNPSPINYIQIIINVVNPNNSNQKEQRFPAKNKRQTTAKYRKICVNRGSRKWQISEEHAPLG